MLGRNEYTTPETEVTASEKNINCPQLDRKKGRFDVASFPQCPFPRNPSGGSRIKMN